MHKDIDIIAAGELLIDFISTDFAEDLDGVSQFVKLPGGSPANLAGNMARLGKRAVLVSSVGRDDMGHFLLRYVASLGVDTSSLRQVAEPTTLILVTRSKQVSNFEAYRLADVQISAEQLPEALLGRCRIFHTTCFGLSREPARSSILSAARRAVALGARPSIDVNYAQKIWPDQAAAQRVVAEYCALGAWVKCSEVDWERLMGYPLEDAAAAAAHFLAWGAHTACLTLGDRGSLLSAVDEETVFLPARSIEVKDTTGAGDAFWSGFLAARLDGHGLLPSAKVGRKMAERKLAHLGPLPVGLVKEEVYAGLTEE